MIGDSVWLPISIFLVSTWLKFKMASASAKILQLLKPPWLTKCRYWSNTCTASCPTLRHSKSTFYALNICWPKLWTTKYMQVGIVSVIWEWHTHPTKRYIRAYLCGTLQFLVQQVGQGSWHLTIRAVMSYKVSTWHVAVFLLVTITVGIFFCKILITTIMSEGKDRHHIHVLIRNQ